MVEPKAGEKYLHFKGKEYEIVCVARDCEDVDRKVVVYRALYDSDDFGFGAVWVRELEDFCGCKKFKEDVEYDGKMFKVGDEVKRFVLMEVDL